MPAAGTGASNPAADGRSYLTFLQGGDLFAVPAEEVSEVAEMPPLTPLPNAPRDLLGVAYMHGEIVAVIDVRGEDPPLSARAARVVVMRKSGDHVRLAVAAEQICDVTRLDEKLGPSDVSFSAGDKARPSAGPLRILSLPLLESFLSLT